MIIKYLDFVDLIWNYKVIPYNYLLRKTMKVGQKIIFFLNLIISFRISSHTVHLKCKLIQTDGQCQ